MRSSYRLGLALSVVLLPSSAAVAAGQASGAPFEFSSKNIMRGPEVYGREPENVRWSVDSRWIYFNWLEPGSDWHQPSKPFRVRAEAGAKPEHMTEAQMDSVATSISSTSPRDPLGD